MRMNKAAVFQRANGRGWLLVLAWGVIACMSMGLVLVWVNIERMDTNYFINIAQNTLKERKSLRAKLQVERERLLSPYELRRRAEEFGMTEPKPGQVRRLQLNEATAGAGNGSEQGKR